MIVHTMTLEEIASEILADSKEVFARWNKFESKFRRMRLKREKYPWLWETTIKTKRNNIWNVIFYAFTKKDASLIHPNFYLSFRYENATWAAYFIQGERKILLFSPHSFERYTERYLNELMVGGIPYSSKDIINVFFCKNYHISIQKLLSNEVSLRGFCEDGMLLGDWLSDTVGLIKTFLSRKELKLNQYTEYFDGVLLWMISDMFLAKNGYMMSDEDFDTFPDTYLSPETWNSYLKNRGNPIWIKIGMDCNAFMEEHREGYKQCSKMLDIIRENRNCHS